MLTKDLSSMRIEADGHVTTITLNRPEQLNSFDQVQHAELLEAIGLIRDQGDARAAILAANGRVFSAGGGFDFMEAAMADPNGFMSLADEGLHIVNAMIDLPIPIVAAVQGDAMGLGATIVLLCDAVVAARKARLCDPHVVAGVAAGDGGCLAWPQALGMLRAKRHLLTGEPMSAEDGYAMGLVTDLVDEPADVLPAARALANRIAALPPVAVQGTKRALNRVLAQRAGEVLELSMAYEARCAFTDDFREAVSALKERRPGVYKGR
jgi:enoyl-CoA hydratase